METQSLLIFSHIINKNKLAVDTLKRIFKKFLFKEVKTWQGYETQWGQIEWYNFFQVLKHAESRLPSQVWNSKMLEECLS